MTSRLSRYVEQALMSFEHDPPDTDFQRGYRAALATVVCEVPVKDGNFSYSCRDFARKHYRGADQCKTNSASGTQQ